MCTLNKSYLGLSTSQEVLAGPCLNREAGGIYIYKWKFKVATEKSFISVV